MSGYHTAQICKNGHLITAYADEYIDSCKQFCTECGAKTITCCSGCNTPIRGKAREYGYLGTLQIPAYCHNCGQPYPWTESALNAANTLIQEDELLNEQEKQQFKETLPDLVVLSPTPSTQLAATRFKRFIVKAAKPTGEAVKSIIADIASETIKKTLGM